jgi:hypothetical protein
MLWLALGGSCQEQVGGVEKNRWGLEPRAL